MELHMEYESIMEVGQDSVTAFTGSIPVITLFDTILILMHENNTRKILFTK